MLVSLFFGSLFAALASVKSTSGVPKEFSNSTDGIDQTYDNEGNRIYGGAYAALGQFPFMAVVHRLAGNGNYFVCGGTILSKRWVLTAAHCARYRDSNEPLKYFVAFGAVDKSEFGFDYVGNEGVGMTTTLRWIHPNYTKCERGDSIHDIALLYMPEDIPFNDNIQPIRLADESYVGTSFENTTGHIYGWGKNQTDNQPSMKLKYAQLPIIANDLCRTTQPKVDATVICTENSMNIYSCGGDSGGPLVVMEKGDEPVQVGIASYGGSLCPSPPIPSAYTRVSAYHAWIREITGISYESGCSCNSRFY